MSPKQVAILLRRQQLLDKIERQRQDIQAFAKRSEKPALLLDQGFKIANQVKQHPRLLIGSALALIVYRRGISGLFKTSWRLWKLYRNTKGLLRQPAIQLAIRYFKRNT